jgi:sugar/nucleoside kinase (ribokinase family)
MVDRAKTKFGSQGSTAPFTTLLPTNAPPLAHQSLDNALYLASYIPHIVLKLGEYGCVFVSRTQKKVRYYPPELLDEATVKSVTGAGDR